jgi:hypothetical protein
MVMESLNIISFVNTISHLDDYEAYAILSGILLVFYGLPAAYVLKMRKFRVDKAALVNITLNFLVIIFSLINGIVCYQT